MILKILLFWKWLVNLNYLSAITEENCSRRLKQTKSKINLCCVLFKPLTKLSFYNYNQEFTTQKIAHLSVVRGLSEFFVYCSTRANHKGAFTKWRVIGLVYSLSVQCEMIVGAVHLLEKQHVFIQTHQTGHYSPFRSLRGQIRYYIK